MKHTKKQKDALEGQWESYEWLIKKDLEMLDHRIQHMYSQMCREGVPVHVAEPYVLPRIHKLIQEVTGGVE